MTALEKLILKTKKGQSFKELLKEISEENLTHISIGGKEYEIDVVSTIAEYIRIKESLGAGVGVSKIIFRWNYNKQTGKLKGNLAIDYHYRTR